jgi:hypothetical protein
MGQSIDIGFISEHSLPSSLSNLKINGCSSIVTIFNFVDHFVPSGFTLELSGQIIFDSDKFKIESFEVIFILKQNKSINFKFIKTIIL